MDSMCRTCMQKYKKLFSILDYKEKDKQLGDILFECTTITIQKNDGLPLHICSNCLQRLISVWDFRMMVIQADMKLHSIINRNHKENILHHNIKCIDMPNANEEAVVVRSKMCHPGNENIDISNNNNILCNCVTECSADNISERNVNVNSDFSSSNIMQAIEEHSGKNKISIINPTTSNKSSNVLKRKFEKILLKDNRHNNFSSMDTNISSSENEMSFKTSRKDKSIVGEDKLLENCQEKVNNVLVNSEKQSTLPTLNIYYCSKEDKNQQKSVSQVSIFNYDNCKSLDIENMESEQPENQADITNKNHCLLNSKNNELDGILLTDNNQSYLERIIDTFDSDENDLKYLELLAQCRNRRFTRKERRKMFVFCKICKKSFNYRTYTERHIFLHKSERLMKCDICSKGFVTKRELDSHKVVHSEDRLFTCKACGKTFKRLNYLTKHEATHLDIEPLKCTLCDKTYKSKELLKIHLQRHKSDTDYLCELCGKLFASLNGLYAHKYVHESQKQYSCSICGKTFSRTIHKRQHMNRHSEERPHTCSYCGKCFKTKDVMEKHSLTHTDVKPYSCRICGKLFKQSASLYNHMRVHTGETPYPCKLCPSRFKYSHHLKNHMKAHN